MSPHAAALAISIALTAALLCGCGQSCLNRSQSMNEIIIIEDQSAAIRRAIVLTGLDAVSNKASAERTTLTGDRTPFLSEQLNGKSVWRVRFGPDSLKLKSAEPGFLDKYERVFDVTLDATTGQLLGVECNFGGEAGEMRPEPAAASGEGGLSGTATG